MKKIAIYAGRFQPFHQGHLSAYNKLVEEFGKENVYIASAEPKVTDERNPFTFSEKKNIINSLFDIPSENITKVKSPYSPVEVLQKFDKDDTMFITAVGEKDGERLAKGRYFRAWNDGDEPIPYSMGGYFITVPNFEMGGDVMSATKIRDKLGNPNVSVQDKIDFFKDVYGKFDRKLFTSMTDTLVKKNGNNAADALQKDTPEEKPQSSKLLSKTDGGTIKRTNDLLRKKVRNPQTRRDILVKTALNYDKNHPAYAAAKKLFTNSVQIGKTGPIQQIFESVLTENALINQFNALVDKYTLASQGRDDLRIDAGDEVSDIERKAKQAYKMGIFYYPLLYALMTADDEDFSDDTYKAHSNNDTLDGPAPERTKPVPVPDPGETFPIASDGEQSEGRQGAFEGAEKPGSSTARVRKYYKKNPGKVKKYLKKTQDDRVARNRDRRRAVKKHGKSYMKDKDVHHPNGPHGGKTKVVKKDHGPDKKNEDEIPGGLADKDTPTTVSKHHKVSKNQILKQLKMGIKVEMEHTDDPKKAAEIALDHIKENPEYYTKLKTIEPQHEMGMVREGGAAGHMMHPYEDMDLTFDEYKEMIMQGLVGDFGEGAAPTEKLDGQNISFSVIDGEVRFARNKGHVKNGGENALSTKGMMEKFKDRGGITRAFVGSAKDLEKTIKYIPSEQLNKIFDNGKKFMSTEIILPDSQNVIPYGKTVIVFHGSIEYDESGNALGFDSQAGHEFNDYVQQYASKKQEVFGMQGPQIIGFDRGDTEDNKKAAQKYIDEIDRLKSEFKLEDNDKVAKYYAKWWQREVTKELDKAGVQYQPEDVEDLVKRFAFDDRSKRLNTFQNKAVAKWASEYQKTRLKDVKKVAQNPFEMLFLRAGADSLKRVEGLMAANNPGAVDQIKNEIDTALRSVSAEETSARADKLRKEFERLSQVGIDKLVPSEGIVFIYKGQPYKFTGTFAPINQLLGTFKFGGPPEQQPTGGAPSGAPPEQGDKQFIKQFYGEKIRNPLTNKEITVQSALTYDKSHPAYRAAQQFLQQKIGGR